MIFWVLCFCMCEFVCMYVHNGTQSNILKVTIGNIFPITSPISQVVFLYEIFSFHVRMLIFYNVQYDLIWPGWTHFFFLNLFFPFSFLIFKSYQLLMYKLKSYNLFNSTWKYNKNVSLSVLSRSPCLTLHSYHLLVNHHITLALGLPSVSCSYFI